MIFVPQQVFHNRQRNINIYDNVKLDYRGEEVTVENFLNLLTGMVLNWYF